VTSRERVGRWPFRAPLSLPVCRTEAEAAISAGIQKRAAKGMLQKMRQWDFLCVPNGTAPDADTRYAP